MNFWLMIIIACSLVSFLIAFSVTFMLTRGESIFEDGWEIVQKEKQDEEDVR